MSRFNETKVERIKKVKKINEAGGEAFKLDDKYALVNIMLTSFLSGGFYESQNTQHARFVELIHKVDPEFAAKLAIYARNKFGMRTITHVAAAEVFKSIHNKKKQYDWAKDFACSVVNRPDDITEILSYWFSIEKSGKLPNSLKKGLAKSFSQFNSYNLAKYKSSNKGISLIDAVNLLHPPFEEKNGMVEVDIEQYWNAIPPKARKNLYKDDFENFKSENIYVREFPTKNNKCKIHTFEALKYGLLKNTETWEAKLSEAGKAETQEEKEQAKLDSWKELVENGSIGQFALLRNLRNILQTGDEELINKACKLLVNEKRIKNSLIFPFRYYTAYLELKDISKSKNVINAISKACDIACDNIPEMNDTAIVVDVSGSMSWSTHNKSKATLMQIAALFGASLYKRGNNDLSVFATDAATVNLDPNTSIISMVDSITKNYHCGGGTNFHSIFDKFKEKYKRVIICTDMQGWVGHNTPETSVSKWMKRVGITNEQRPWIYCVNIAGHDSSQFNPNDNKVVNVSGFSEKIFDLIKIAETDRNALINEIENIQFV